MPGRADTHDTVRELWTLRPWLPAVAVGLMALSLSVALEARPRDPAAAVAVFPPWWNSAQALDAAGRAGAVTAVGALPFIIVVRSTHGPVGPRLRVAGAWLNLDPALAGLCGS